MNNLRHLIAPDDLTPRQTDAMLDLADRIVADPIQYASRCAHKKIATLFYEPSTRTRLSFEAAMMELGGGVLGFSSADSSSASKGETVADTVRTVQHFADIIAIRHPKEGAAAVAAAHSIVPVINAGDGGHLHPTQTLTDLMTIRALRQAHSLENFTIGFCGDLMFGRTVHSLARALMPRKGVKFFLISPKELRLPAYLLDELKGKNIPFEESQPLDDVMGQLDVLYMTRVQRERFFNEEEYLRLRDIYLLNAGKMRLAKKDMMVLHPLPRVNEIAAEVDSDVRAAYFRQVGYGKYVRMALILTLLGMEETQ